MKPNLIKDKSFDFAIRIVQLFKHLTKKKKEFVLSKQLFRSGTAISAFIYEAEHAQSRLNYIQSISSALKEANKTIFWLKLLSKNNHIDKPSYTDLTKEAYELLKLLIIENEYFEQYDQNKL